jgi:hypothetical protein
VPDQVQRALGELSGGHLRAAGGMHHGADQAGLVEARVPRVDRMPPAAVVDARVQRLLGPAGPHDRLGAAEDGPDVVQFGEPGGAPVLGGEASALPDPVQES